MLRPIHASRAFVLLACIALLSLAGGSFAAMERSFVSGNFAFQLDGISCGLLKQMEGGNVSADVVEEPVGGGAFTRKHLGALNYEPITLQCDFSLGKPVYDWISASLTSPNTRHDGQIHTCDYDMNIKSTMDFFHALITEVGFPACDAASKDPAYMTIKFAPEIIKYSKPPTPTKPAVSVSDQAKLWLPSNFRLEIDGLDCTKVNKIESFTIKRMIASNAGGGISNDVNLPGKLIIPNLKITLAEVGAESWRQWFDDFVIKGNNGDDREKRGRLIFLSPNRATELARIEFYNLGIYRLAPDVSSPDSDQIKRVTAELYCERMVFSTGGGGTLRLPAGINIKDILK